MKDEALATQIDRTAVFCTAHAGARPRVANNRAWRSYREAFADALRAEWRRAKDAAAVARFRAAEAALPPIPAAVAEEAAEMRRWAWYQPITSAGTARMVAQLAAANAMEAAARASAIHHH